MFAEMNQSAGKYDYKPAHDDVFYSLSEFYNVVDAANNPKAVFRIHGVFFFDTQYGESAAMIGDDVYIYVPKNMVETFRKIDADSVMSEMLMQGRCGFTLNKYKAHGKQCTGMKLVDLPENFTPNAGVFEELPFS